MANFSRVTENESILQHIEEKRSVTASELRSLNNRLGTMLESMRSGEITKSEGSDGMHCALNETPTKLEFMDSRYSYILPSVEKIMMSIPDSDLRWGLEYLLNDYRRMWYRRYSVGMQMEDNPLAEIKVWTDDNRSRIVIPSRLSQIEEQTERNKRDLTLRMEKLRDLQKSVVGIKDQFSKLSAEVISQMQREKDAYGFSFQKALQKLQEMTYDDQEEAESVEDLIKKIDTFEKLMEKQRLRLTDLFQADKDVNEKIHEARKLLSDADTFQNDREKHRLKLDNQGNDWCRSQERIYKKLTSCAETIASQLKCHLCMETRNSIIAKESVNEYERLLSAEKRHLDMRDNLPPFRVSGASSLLASVSHPDLIKYANLAKAALDECKDVTLRMSKQIFDRLSREIKATQSSVTKDLMRTTADNEIESDLLKLKYRMKDNTSFPSLIMFLFDIMDRELKEYVRLLKVQRLRDVQMSTLAHNIEVVALSVARQAVSRRIPTAVYGTHKNSSLPKIGRSVSFHLGKTALQAEIHSKINLKRRDTRGSKKSSYEPNAVDTDGTIKTFWKYRHPIPKRHGTRSLPRTGKRASEAHQQNQFSLGSNAEENQQGLNDLLHETIKNEHIASDLLNVSENAKDVNVRERMYCTSEMSVAPWSYERF